MHMPGMHTSCDIYMIIIEKYMYIYIDYDIVKIKSTK